jgi:hypothetical protein
LRGHHGWLKTWVPGTSPGKGHFEPKLVAKCSDELPFDFPRTVLRLMAAMIRREQEPGEITRHSADRGASQTREEGQHAEPPD